MAYVVSNGHVTYDVPWSLKVLWGSTVGYPSDSLASCYLLRRSQSPRCHNLGEVHNTFECAVVRDRPKTRAVEGYAIKKTALDPGLSQFLGRYAVNLIPQYANHSSSFAVFRCGCTVRRNRITESHRLEESKKHVMTSKFRQTVTT